MGKTEITANDKPSKKRSQASDVWRRMRKDKVAIVGMVIISIFILCAIFADVIADYQLQAIKQNGSIRLLPPSAEHWFGTDAFGRDIFARIVHGARISLTIGLATTAISLAIGGLLGSACGYYGGWFDIIIMRIMDMLTCIPAILLALAIVAALGTSITNLLIAITVACVPGYVRLIRATIMNIVGQDFIEAAKACGTSVFRIIARHILPNAIGPVLVMATGAIAGMILTTAGLSFIGFGVQPPTPEWGAMLNDARDYMRTHPHVMIFPGLAIILATLSINLIGDALRDALDPRLKD